MRDEAFKEYVLEQLAALPGLLCRPMFGGYGLSAGRRFFGIVHDDRLYFKTDATTRDRYLSYGMQPFRPRPKQTLKNYFEVPIDVLEDRELLLEWAEAAIAVEQP